MRKERVVAWNDSNDYSSPMVVHTFHRFTVQDYHRMGETGVLPPESRVELIEGQIIDRSPIGPLHGGVTKFLNRFFATAAKDRWLVAVQDPLQLDDFSEPQPDLMLLKPNPHYYRKQHPKPNDVMLVIEVGDTSLVSDRETKLPAYGRAGITEVWIVDLAAKAMEIYREPHFTGFESKTVLRPGDFAAPRAFPDVRVDIAALLDS